MTGTRGPQPAIPQLQSSPSPSNGVRRLRHRYSWRQWVALATGSLIIAVFLCRIGPGAVVQAFRQPG